MNHTARIAGTLLLIANVLSLDACRSASTQAAAAQSEQVRARQALIDAGDADSLAAAALLIVYPAEPQRRYTLLSAAVTRAPDRADLQWLRLQACAALPGCDTAPLAQALRRLDPDNAAAWLPAIGAAWQQGEAAALQVSLAAAADAHRFDLYWTRRVSGEATALSRVGHYTPRVALVSALGSGTQLSIPPLQALFAACKPPATDAAARLDACRRLAAVMAAGDTVLIQSLGLKLALRTWPAESPAWSAAAAALRDLRYRQQAQASLTTRSLRSDARALRYIAVLGAYRTEDDAGQAVLADAHHAAHPPADWKDPDPP